MSAHLDELARRQKIFKEIKESPFPDLPYGTKDFLFNMSNQYGYDPRQIYFKSFFMRGLRDETGTVVFDTLKERFIHLYAETEEEMNQAVDEMIHLFGDAFHYSISPLHKGVYSFSEKDTMEDVTLHFRSRLFKAVDLYQYLKHTEPSNCISLLLKSAYVITITEEPGILGQSKSYMGAVKFSPSSAIFKEENKLYMPDVISAIEKIINSKTHDYDKEIDKHFDTVKVVILGNEGEFHPKENKSDLLEYIRKVVLQSTLGSIVQ